MTQANQAPSHPPVLLPVGRLSSTYSLQPSGLAQHARQRSVEINSPSNITRRRFIQVAAATSLAPLLGPSAGWAQQARPASRAIPSSGESLPLVGLGLSHRRFSIARTSILRQRAALGLVVFALGVYPLIGLALGRSWTQAEVIGLAPDPTALATLGILLLTGTRSFWVLAPIPILWCLISDATLWAMASPDFFIAPGLALLAAMLASLDRTKQG